MEINESSFSDLRMLSVSAIDINASCWRFALSESRKGKERLYRKGCSIAPHCEQKLIKVRVSPLVSGSLLFDIWCR